MASNEDTITIVNNPYCWTNVTNTAPTDGTAVVWGNWCVGNTAVVGDNAGTIDLTVWDGWNTQIEAVRARFAQVGEAAERFEVALQDLTEIVDRGVYGQAQPLTIGPTLARQRARALLISLLNDQQRNQLEKERFFEVIAQGSRRRYRIYEGSHGNVRLCDNNGRVVARYCGQPNNVPIEDMMTAQMLQIQYDEAAYLKSANKLAA